MTIAEITGGMLRAARGLTGLSQQEFAERASISRPCLTAWEGSSGSVPNAKARALHRVVAALEAEGIRFSGRASAARSSGAWSKLVVQNDSNRIDHSASQSGDRTCIRRILRLVEFRSARPINP